MSLAAAVAAVAAVVPGVERRRALWQEKLPSASWISPVSNHDTRIVFILSNICFQGAMVARSDIDSVTSLSFDCHESQALQI